MARHQPQAVRRARSLSRIVGAICGVIIGLLYGAFIITNSQGLLDRNRVVALAALLGSSVAGAATLALAAPRLSVDPFLWLEETLSSAPASEIAGALVGLVTALLISALVAVLLSALPWGLGVLLSIAVACVLVYVGVQAGRSRREALTTFLGGISARSSPRSRGIGLPDAILLDTSALIDGRVVDVVRSGFLRGRLLLPTFVLEELQAIADSADARRRARGRRGLDTVAELEQSTEVECELMERDVERGKGVDVSLVALARALGASLMTTDYNLDRLARVEDVRVLNLNDLATALKPTVMTGEKLRLTILREGRSPGQGVGYLEDGTMVVVENARAHLEQEVTVVVSNVRQTAAGRMIFASLEARDAGAGMTVRGRGAPGNVKP
jgi:uncharacterized protein YacL